MISARAEFGVTMKRPNWKAIGFLAFIAVGAVSAALGCPFFRNPENYMSAGGFVGYVQHLVSVHRKTCRVGAGADFRNYAESAIDGRGARSSWPRSRPSLNRSRQTVLFRRSYHYDVNRLRTRSYRLVGSDLSRGR